MVMTPSINSAPPDLLIGGYHKTGTVWLRRLAQTLADELGRPFVNISQHVFDLNASIPDQRTGLAKKILEQTTPKVIFDCNCRFLPIKNVSEKLGFRLVRDPRDVVISSANYHGWSDEPWLHRPRPEWNGASYQQTMKNLDLAGAIHFEIDHMAGNVVKEMLDFKLGAGFGSFTYEKTVVERHPSVTRELAQHLQVPVRAVTLSLEKSWNTSAARTSVRNAGIRSHIQDGGSEQWIYVFDREHVAHLNDVLPECAERLGYRGSSESELQPNAAKKLRYSSKFWANRKDYGRAIEDATELLRLSDDAVTKEWIVQLHRMSAEANR